MTSQCFPHIDFSLAGYPGLLTDGKVYLANHFSIFAFYCYPSEITTPYAIIQLVENMSSFYSSRLLIIACSTEKCRKGLWFESLISARCGIVCIVCIHFTSYSKSNRYPFKELVPGDGYIVMICFLHHDIIIFSFSLVSLSPSIYSVHSARLLKVALRILHLIATQSLCLRSCRQQQMTW